jgi:hypothetical protein
VVAPSLEDMIVSKLARLSNKDKDFVEAYHAERPLDLKQIVERIKATSSGPELQQRAIDFVTCLVKRPGR